MLYLTVSLYPKRFLFLLNNNEHLFCEGQDCIEGIWSASQTAERLKYFFSVLLLVFKHNYLLHSSSRIIFKVKAMGSTTLKKIIIMWFGMLIWSLTMKSMFLPDPTDLETDLTKNSISIITVKSTQTTNKAQMLTKKSHKGSISKNITFWNFN